MWRLSVPLLFFFSLCMFVCVTGEGMWKKNVVFPLKKWSDRNNFKSFITICERRAKPQSQGSGYSILRWKSPCQAPPQPWLPADRLSSPLLAGHAEPPTLSLTDFFFPFWTISWLHYSVSCLISPFSCIADISTIGKIWIFLIRFLSPGSTF